MSVYKDILAAQESAKSGNRLAGQQPRQLKIYDAAHALRPRPPKNWIVAPLLAPGDVGTLSGGAGDGKTFSICDLSIKVAAGKQTWIGFEISQCPVLFVDEESGEDRLSRRIAECLLGSSADENTPIHYVCLPRLNLLDPEDARLLRDAIQQTQSRLVVFDALIDLITAAGGDENSAADVQAIYNRLREIAQDLSCAILIIHHTGKNGSTRGSSAIQGASDIVLNLTRNGKSPIVTFETEKERDLAPRKFSARLNWLDGMFWMDALQAEPEAQKLPKSHEYVLRFLSQNGDSLISEIMAHADVCSDKSARAAVYKLAGMDLIQRVDDGGPGEAAVYGLTEQGGKVFENNRFES